MNASDPVIAIVREQRKRFIAAVLGHAEREIYADLTPAQQQAFRAKVLTAVNAFADFTIDTLRGVQGWVNEEAVQVLAEISSQTRNTRGDR